MFPLTSWSLCSQGAHGFDGEMRREREGHRFFLPVYYSKPTVRHTKCTVTGIRQAFIPAVITLPPHDLHEPTPMDGEK